MALFRKIKNNPIQTLRLSIINCSRKYTFTQLAPGMYIYAPELGHYRLEDS